ncbi:MAG: IS1595 family transposase [Hyphomicrobiaceae bacterium]|jgi:transposase-like protein
MSLLSQKHLQNEEAAYAWVEARIWPNGAVCAHCGEDKRVSKMQGKATRIGLYKCYACRKQFNVKIGTIFEKSHIQMHLWLQAFYLLAGSKKGISSNQLSRTLGVTLKSAWFMSHRIREAMRSGSLAPMGGSGDSGVVEVDETYIGTKDGTQKAKGGYGHKRAVVTLVNRHGQARSFHVDKANTATVMPIIRENISSEAVVITDESRIYDPVQNHAAHHARINHFRDEYVSEARSEWITGDIHTNTVEGYFSLFKRGMRGVYQHCAEKHLHRYLAEFDFRYNNRVKLGVDDQERAARAVEGAVGKRLTYRTTNQQVTDA